MIIKDVAASFIPGTASRSTAKLAFSVGVTSAVTAVALKVFGASSATWQTFAVFSATWLVGAALKSTGIITFAFLSTVGVGVAALITAPAAFSAIAV